MEYELGKWYVCDYGIHGIHILRYEGLAKGHTDILEFREDYTSLGTSVTARGHKCSIFTGDKSFKGLATPAQIEQCLTAYARKNGYFEGVKVKCLSRYKKEYKIGGNFFYVEDLLYCVDKAGTGVPIYSKVRWAEIVQEPVKEEEKGIVDPRQHAIDCIEYLIAEGVIASTHKALYLYGQFINEIWEANN